MQCCSSCTFYPAEAEIIQQLSVPLPFPSAVHKQPVDRSGSQKHHSHLGGKMKRLARKKKKKKGFLKDICLLHSSWLRTSTRSFPGILNSRNTKPTVIIHRFDFTKLLFPLTHNLGDDRNAKVSKCFKLVGFNWNIYQEKYSDITRAVTNSPLVCNKIQIQYNRGYNHVITNSQYSIMRLRMSQPHCLIELCTFKIVFRPFNSAVKTKCTYIPFCHRSCLWEWWSAWLGPSASAST